MKSRLQPSEGVRGTRVRGAWSHVQKRVIVEIFVHVKLSLKIGKEKGKRKKSGRIKKKKKKKRKATDGAMFFKWVPQAMVFWANGLLHALMEYWEGFFYCQSNGLTIRTHRDKKKTHIPTHFSRISMHFHFSIYFSHISIYFLNLNVSSMGGF